MNADRYRREQTQPPAQGGTQDKRTQDNNLIWNFNKRRDTD